MLRSLTKFLSLLCLAWVTCLAPPAVAQQLTDYDPNKPGAALGNRVFTVTPAQTFRFEAWENGLIGFGSVMVPDHALAPYVYITRVERERRRPGPGGKTLYVYTLMAADNAPPNTDIVVQTTGEYQTRQDPNWAFRFTLHVQN